MLDLELIYRELKKRLEAPVELKYKLLSSEAKAPKLSHPGDSCFDVFATSSIGYEANYLEFGTGLSFDIPEGYELKVYARSSISTTSLMLANGVGVVDQNYKGELMVRFKAITPYTGHIYIAGDRIAQIQLVRKTPTVLTECTEVGQSTRGAGGFGSTGKN